MKPKEEKKKKTKTELKSLPHRPPPPPPPPVPSGSTPRPPPKFPKRMSAAAAVAATLDSSALAAIALVDAAALHLPPESSIQFSLMAEGEGGFQIHDGVSPPNFGQKEPPPRGHPDCFTGKTFVISGVLDSLPRPDAEDLIKRHGGRVTGSVSGKTNFLIVGTSCGRSKYTLAKEKGTKLIDEVAANIKIARTASVVRPLLHHVLMHPQVLREFPDLIVQLAAVLVTCGNSIPLTEQIDLLTIEALQLDGKCRRHFQWRQLCDIVMRRLTEIQDVGMLVKLSV
eukprot:CAMPEP_0175058444 /NCGR_PEP_ID=MMETSP0052_2-20121109/11852_1 /TAXON_ID=51329 ORGANISM="Polytomella parva, Strain SAG 63-3" /NCGR_SAMPLE_ID=MMETSP0052_2 /ASSEMBLY_ACC=CAM_ASM_000194 /LENGTH=282 /DNA_ID=CAMNT_0016323827 /DNA_START=610 /DNA_END=1454 /DNA_ORIENTATION=-